MGDLVHNMPLIADIREHFPDAVIDWVVEQSFLDVARLNTQIDTFIPIAMRRWKHALTHASTWKEFAAFRRQLKAREYDAILDTQGLLKSALISRWARGASHGQNSHTAREAVAGHLYTYPHDIPRNLHAITRNRLLGAAAFNYALPQTPPVYQLAVPEQALPITVPPSFILAMHGTARDAKLWPTQHWIELGKHLSRQNLPLLLPWGNSAEHDRAKQIASAVPGAAVLPKMNLAQLACLIGRATAVVGLDTGLMHLAVALNIPTLAIFTDTDIWQAGTLPGIGGKALTIGGKPANPEVKEAVAALETLGVLSPRNPGLPK